MGASGFPIDLILFGMIALFLVLRLRSVLGRRTGFERPASPPSLAEGGTVIEGHAEPVTAPPAPTRGFPPPDSPAAQTLAQMRRIDRGFDPMAFLIGAEGAFRLIVTAYAKGDRATLAPLLGPETRQVFEAAISAREAAGETLETEIKALLAATITDAALAGTRASITVRFVSDQASLTRGSNGEIVHGNEAVTEITDLWVFERDLTSADPTWRLAAAQSH
jgi:predicted lipid-binding transport protein (Tim44 family)